MSTEECRIGAERLAALETTVAFMERSEMERTKKMESYMENGSEMRRNSDQRINDLVNAVGKVSEQLASVNVKLEGLEPFLWITRNPKLSLVLFLMGAYIMTFEGFHAILGNLVGSIMSNLL